MRYCISQHHLSLRYPVRWAPAVPPPVSFITKLWSSITGCSTIFLRSQKACHSLSWISLHWGHSLKMMCIAAIGLYFTALCLFCIYSRSQLDMCSGYAHDTYNGAPLTVTKTWNNVQQISNIKKAATPSTTHYTFTNALHTAKWHALAWRCQIKKNELFAILASHPTQQIGGRTSYSVYVSRDPKRSTFEFRQLGGVAQFGTTSPWEFARHNLVTRITLTYPPRKDLV